MAPYSLTADAEKELEEIIQYSQMVWRSAQADQTMSIFENCFKNIALFPQSGQLLPHATDRYQKAVAGVPFWAVYHAAASHSTVTIVQIIHTSRNR